MTAETYWKDWAPAPEKPAVEVERDRYRSALLLISTLHKGAITRTCATIAQEALAWNPSGDPE